MKTRKLISRVRELIDGGALKKRREHEALESLVEKLKKKQLRLTAKIQLEEDAAEREALSRKLALVNAHLAKAGRILEEGG